MFSTATSQNPLHWLPQDTTPEIAAALRDLAVDYPQLVEGESVGRRIRFRKVEAPAGGGITSQVVRDGREYEIRYSNLTGALRGVGTALAGLASDEGASFTRLGIMLDCSRNKVMKPSHFKHWLRRLALMGYTYVLDRKSVV